MTEPNLIHPIADTPESGYDPECRKCLDGKVHTVWEHQEELYRAWEVSYWEYEPNDDWSSWDKALDIVDRDFKH